MQGEISTVTDFMHRAPKDCLAFLPFDSDKKKVRLH